MARTRLAVYDGEQIAFFESNNVASAYITKDSSGIKLVGATTYVANLNLTAGAISNGSWQGSKVAEIYGGTNQSAYTTGDILYASGTNTLAKLAIGATGKILSVSGGVPAWSDTIAGSLVITGNLTVQGTTITIASTEMAVVDKNITVNVGGSGASSAGAGLTVIGGNNANTAGTGTVSSSGMAVTGAGTAFITELTPGMSITANGQTRIVDVISDATHLTVTVAFSPNVTTQAFTYVKSGSLIWDTTAKQWKGGVVGAEQELLTPTGTAYNASHVDIGAWNTDLDYYVALVDGQGASNCHIGGTINITANPFTGVFCANRFTSLIATGTAPLTVASTTVVSNLNADLLDGNHSSAFALVGQTMYIGTTGVAINRSSGALTLAGLTLTTPNIGVATATSVNKVTITSPTTSATLTLVTGSSLITVGAYSLTLTSTATTNVTFPSGTKTLLATDGSAASLTSFPTLNQNTTGTASNITAYTINQNLGTGNSPTFAGLTVASGSAAIDITVGSLAYPGKIGLNTADDGANGFVLTLTPESGAGVTGSQTITVPAATGTISLTSHNHSGVYAPVAQTFYIGTTSVAINRASAALTLAGLTFTTPDIGVATATSVNKVTITAPTTSATLTLVTGSSLITVGAYALTLTSTATTNVTFPSGTKTLLATDGSAANLTNFPTLNQNTTGSSASCTGNAYNASHVDIGAWNTDLDYYVALVDGQGASNCHIGGTINITANPFTGVFCANRFTSLIATGTAPLTVASTTVVSNLNADLLDGNHSSAFATVGQTFYIGTTSIAINRASGNLTLTGVTITGVNGTAGAPAFSFSADTNTGIYGNGSDSLLFSTAGTNRWTINASGHLIAGADASYDIGAAGATRPRSVYISGTLYAGTAIQINGVDITQVTRSEVVAGVGGIAQEASVTVTSFIAGTNKLLVFVDGVLMRRDTNSGSSGSDPWGSSKDKDYYECAANGAACTTIRFNFDIAQGGVVQWILLV